MQGDTSHWMSVQLTVQRWNFTLLIAALLQIMTEGSCVVVGIAGSAGLGGMMYTALTGTQSINGASLANNSMMAYQSIGRYIEMGCEFSFQ